MKEIYISTDIETDGPIPGENSMLSFGSAAFTLDDGSFNSKLVSTFSRNLVQLDGASPDPKTKSEFWDKNPEAWAACRKDLTDPELAMLQYKEWLAALPGKPVFVGYPATFDFMFVYWYLIKFTGSSPFSFSALDIKSYAMATLQTDFRSTTKRAFPKEWFSASPHTHVALDDAIEQGEMFMRMMKHRLSGR